MPGCPTTQRRAALAPSCGCLAVGVVDIAVLPLTTGHGEAALDTDSTSNLIACGCSDFTVLDARAAKIYDANARIRGARSDSKSLRNRDWSCPGAWNTR